MYYKLLFYKNGKPIETQVHPEGDKSLFALVQEVLTNETGDPDVVFGLYDAQDNLLIDDEDVHEWA